MPYLSVFLLKLQSNFHKLGIHQPIGLYDRQLMQQSSGDPEWHPLWVPQQFATIEYILEVNVYNFALSSNQYVIRMSIPKPHNISEITPMRICPDKVIILTPPLINKPSASPRPRTTIKKPMQLIVNKQTLIFIHTPQYLSLLRRFHNQYQFLNILFLQFVYQQCIKGSIVLDVLYQYTIF